MKIGEPELLEVNQPMVLRAGERRVLYAIQGTVWLTSAGQVEDIFLLPGETYSLASKGHTIIEAVRGSALIALCPSAKMNVLAHTFSWVKSRCKAIVRSCQMTPTSI